MGSNRACERTPRAVGRLGLDARVGYRRRSLACHQYVLHCVARDVSALHERGRRTHLAKRLAGLDRRFLAIDLDIGEDGGLVGVRRHERRLCDQVLVGVLARGFEQSVARGRDHYRIDDERKREVARAFGDELHHVGGCEHAGLRCSDVEVPDHCVELCADLRGRKHVNAFDPMGVLCGRRGEHARSERPTGFHRLQVGLDACPTPRVARRDRERHRDGRRCRLAGHRPLTPSSPSSLLSHDRMVQRGGV